MWAAVRFIFAQGVRLNRSPSRKEIRIAAKAKEEFSKRNSGINNPNYGKPIPEYRKEEMRLLFKGKKLSPEHVENIRLSKVGLVPPRGFTHSEDTKAKQSIRQTGKTHSEETKAKISASHVGKKHSDSHRQALSVAKRGKPACHLHTPEVRAKRGLALRGREVSEETRLKQSLSRTGKTASLETKQKMSQKKSGSKNYKAKAVVCLTTSECFGCLVDAADRFLIPRSSLRSALRRNSGRAFVGGFEFEVTTIEKTKVLS